MPRGKDAWMRGGVEKQLCNQTPRHAELGSASNQRTLFGKILKIQIHRETHNLTLQDDVKRAKSLNSCSPYNLFTLSPISRFNFSAAQPLSCPAAFSH